MWLSRWKGVTRIGETVGEGAAQIAVSYISQLFDNAGDTEPRGTSLELKMSSAP